MSLIVLSIWIGCLVCDAGGQLAFKAAALSTRGAEGLAHFTEALRSPWTWIGLFVYVGEFILWLAFLSYVPLSKAVLLSSVNILSVMLGGRLFFGDAITLQRGIAAMLISSGVMLVGTG